MAAPELLKLTPLEGLRKKKCEANGGAVKYVRDKILLHNAALGMVKLELRNAYTK